MLHKQLISIHFFKNRIQIILLNGSRNKIEKMASVSLPKGIVINHTIKDSVALSMIIKEAWIKLKIKEKTVGIVVPEFATFTKLISLPGLKSGELDEAIEWQAKEFLPTGIDDMFMDWKIVSKKDDIVHILIVAIKKDTLSGYVNAVDEAGLLPVVVETPALSLSRLIDNEQDDSLIIYSLQGEGILVVCQGGAILGSSVVFNTDPSDILSTAKRILKHFDVKIKKIYVAGDLTDSLIEDGFLKELSAEVVMIDINIQGLDKKMLNEYLIPISLQSKVPSEPADPSTINLLPASFVNRYKDKTMAIQVWGVTLTITLFVWVSFLLVLGSFLFISQLYNVEVTKSTEKGSILQQRRETLEKVNEINQTVEKVTEIKNITILPKQVLNEIFSAGSDSIDIENYVLDLDRGDVQVVGVASDRNSLIAFQQNLDKIENIISVRIPISSFEVEQNLEFTASIKYQVSD